MGTGEYQSSHTFLCQQPSSYEIYDTEFISFNICNNHFTTTLIPYNMKLHHHGKSCVENFHK